MNISAWRLFCFGGLALVATAASAAVSPEQAAALGRSLTQAGAEMAGNREGSIPPYTGGLTKPPAGFDARKLVRPDPFADEKPLFSINGQSITPHADKLSDGTRELLKFLPGFRIDVYQTHRTVAYPASVLDQTEKNALRATLSASGMGFNGAQGGIPFPIPQSGQEVMHNVHARYTGLSQWIPDYRNFYVDAKGEVVMSGRAALLLEYPHYDAKRENPSPLVMRNRRNPTFPPNVVGQSVMQWEPLSYADNERRYWQYMPGQRRVRPLPGIEYDQIMSASGGMGTVDDLYLFSGKLDRFDFKLIGKRELYVPYNTYRLTYHDEPSEVLLQKFINPQFVRWELHRVWVVEATLKEGARHIYSRRNFFIDEDSWAILVSDQYDRAGKLSRVGFAYLHQAYDAVAPLAITNGYYDLSSGGYYLVLWPGKEGVKFSEELLPDTSWSPEGLGAQGVR